MRYAVGSLTLLQPLSGMRGRFVSGAAWNLLASVCNQGSTLLANVLVARLIGRQLFGEFTMLQSTLLTFASLAQVSTGLTATRYVAEFRTSDPARAGRIVGLCEQLTTFMSMIGAVALLAASPWLSTTMLKAPQLALGLALGLGYLVFSALNGYQIGTLIGLEGYRSLTYAGILSGTLALVCICLSTSLWGLNGAMAGLSISACLRCLFHRHWMRTELRRHGLVVQTRGAWQEYRIITSFAVPAILASYFSLPAIWYANSVLARQPDGYPQMALYGAGTSIRLLVLFIPGVINSVAMSLLSNTRGRSEAHRYDRLLRSSVLVALLSALCGIVLLGSASGLILHLFGKDFHVGQPVVWMLLLSTIPESLANALFQDIFTRGRLWLAVATVNIPRETTFVLLASLWVPHAGAMGLARAYCAASILELSVILILTAGLRRSQSALSTA